MRLTLVVASTFLIVAASSGCSTDRPAPTSPPSTASSTGSPDSEPAQPVSLEVVAARAAHGASSLPSGEVFVTGGCVVDGCSEATTETFVLDAAGAGAVRGPEMAQPRQGHSATLAGDAVVLAGGWPGEGTRVNDSVEVFRPSTGTLDTIGALAVPRGGHAAAPLADGTVLVVGGWIASRTYTPTAEVVDPDGGPTGHAADLPYTADALDAVAMADGRILVTGGQVRSAVATDQAAIYDPAADSWQPVGPMNTPRLKHYSVLLADGRVLVIGGTTDDETLLASTELFDPRTGTFSEGPQLTEPRYKLTGGAMVLDSNRVLIGGGGRSIEVLDLSSGEATVVESLTERGSFTTVNALGSGSVLVLGGYDDRISLTRNYVVLSPSDLGFAMQAR